MITNPAWVTSAKTGKEVMFFSVNALAGTNSFAFEKKFLFNGFNGQAKEGIDYFRKPEPQAKHLWANLEINGPAISFALKKQHYIGVFTRVRQLYRGGNIHSTQFRLIGQALPETYYGSGIKFHKVGFSTHTFSEVGITYGRILKDDYYNVLSGGVSLKYLMGFVAGSIYTNDLTYTADSSDVSFVGDFNAYYTHNISSFIDNNAQNDLTSWFQRAGRWGLGLDIGVQYEYHPDGNPNYPTPYLFSLAASITDVGTIGYIADTGSGSYDININSIDTLRTNFRDDEGINNYLVRTNQDTLFQTADLVDKFSMGLPTAFRLSADYNVSYRFNFATNLLLNLKGNGGQKYRSAYINYLNFTPSYKSKFFYLGMPFTLMSYQTFNIGLSFRTGPFYIGSSSAITTLFFNTLTSIDAYMGFVWKFKKRDKKVRLSKKLSK